MFPLWLPIVIIFYFLSGYWLWKLINIFYCCEKKKNEENFYVLMWKDFSSNTVHSRAYTNSILLLY